MNNYLKVQFSCLAKQYWRMANGNWSGRFDEGFGLKAVSSVRENICEHDSGFGGYVLWLDGTTASMHWSRREAKPPSGCMMGAPLVGRQDARCKNSVALLQFINMTTPASFHLGHVLLTGPMSWLPLAGELETKQTACSNYKRAMQTEGGHYANPSGKCESGLGNRRQLRL